MIWSHASYPGQQQLTSAAGFAVKPLRASTVVAPLRKEVSLDSLGEAARGARAEIRAWLKREESVPEQEAPEAEAVSPWHRARDCHRRRRRR